MKNFFKAKTTLALDISMSGLRLLEIDNNKKTTTVRSYGSIELFPDKVEASLENSDGFLEEQLVELIQTKLIGQPSTSYVNVTIPSAKTFSRAIKLPKKVESEINSAVDLEIEQYIPLPKEMLAIDYTITARDKNEIEITIIAAPKTIINRVIEITRSVGLEPVLIEPSIDSIARLLVNDEQGYLKTLIIDIGLTNTDIAVLDNGIRATSSIRVGGNDFTLALAEGLNVSNEKAYQLKVLKGLNKSPQQSKIIAVLDPHIKRILSEINKILRYNDERLGGQKIEQIIITGLGSNLAGIGEYLTNELYLPVRIANPWQYVEFHKIPKPKRVVISRYITATGAALLRNTEIY